MEPIKITESAGRGKFGKTYFFIHPANGCINRSRRVTQNRIDETINKYYSPLNLYMVDGYRIGANSPENAVKEYRRICNIKNINKKVNPIII